MKKTNPIFLLFYSLAIVMMVIAGFVFFPAVREEPQETITQETITIGIGTWAGFATGMVGMEQNLFHGLKVETRILDDNVARHSAFQSSFIDIMISSIDVFSQEAAQGIRGKVFLITDESWGGDGIVAKSEIKEEKDLRGKKIAYARGTPSHYLLHKVLKRNGMNMNDIEHVQVDDPGRAGDVFLSGGVDAAVTWEPFLSKVAESGKGHILATTMDYPEIIVDVLVASAKLANAEETLHRFMDGWLKSVEYIKKHPDGAAGIMAKGLNLPIEDVQGMMTGLKFADRNRNQYFFDVEQPANTRLAKLFDEAGSYWKSVGIVDKPMEGATRISPTASRYFNPN